MRVCGRSLFSKCAADVHQTATVLADHDAGPVARRASVLSLTIAPETSACLTANVPKLQTSALLLQPVNHLDLVELGNQATRCDRRPISRRAEHEVWMATSSAAHRDRAA